MKEFLSSPFFGIVVSIIAFRIGVLIQKISKTPVANPLLISIALIIVFIKTFNISYEDYNVGGQIISTMLVPATAILAVSIYNQAAVLKKYFIPAVAGCFVGSLTAIVSIVLMCRAFGLDEALTASLMPKSVTTAIAIGISEQHGGLVPVTVAAVIVTGVFGAVFAPLLVKLFRIKDPVTTGISIGTSSHVGGTSTAITMGEIEGAMSSIAIGIAGLITTFLSVFF
ncbi:MAG TPA: LrgB family protein [Clostridiales bacterium]|nr:LrgB family protein [Clostridiales bacterium]